jgi:hypothetical protein
VLFNALIGLMIVIGTIGFEPGLLIYGNQTYNPYYWFCKKV